MAPPRQRMKSGPKPKREESDESAFDLYAWLDKERPNIYVKITSPAFVSNPRVCAKEEDPVSGKEEVNEEPDSADEQKTRTEVPRRPRGVSKKVRRGPIGAPIGAPYRGPYRGPVGAL